MSARKAISTGDSALPPPFRARFRLLRPGLNRMHETTRDVFDWDLNQPALLRLLTLSRRAQDEPEAEEAALMAWAADTKTGQLAAQVRVREAGRVPGPGPITLYFVCEPPSGQRLADWLRERGPLPEREAIRASIRLIELLDSVWQKQERAHLGLTPHTVHVERLPDGDLVFRFETFGLMDALRSRWTELALDPSEAIWMAPEERQGEDWGPRTDLWAVGRLLAALCGCGEDLSALSPRLRRVIGELTQPDPQARPTNHAEALALLRQLLTAPPRRSWVLPLGLALALTAAGAALWSLWPSASPPAAEPAPVAPRAETPAAPPETPPAPPETPVAAPAGVLAGSDVPLQCSPAGATVREGEGAPAPCPAQILFPPDGPDRRTLTFEAAAHQPRTLTVARGTAPLRVTLKPLAANSQPKKPGSNKKVDLLMQR